MQLKFNKKFGTALVLVAGIATFALVSSGSAEEVSSPIGLREAMSSHGASGVSDREWQDLYFVAQQTPSDAAGVPSAADLKGQENSVLSLGSDEVGHVKLAPASKGTGFCFTLDLVEGLGNPGVPESSGCTPEFPADQVLWSAYNLGPDIDIQLLGFASDAVDHLNVLTESGASDRVAVVNGAFSWVTENDSKDPGATLQVVGKDGNVIASHTISQIYDRDEK